MRARLLNVFTLFLLLGVRAAVGQASVTDFRPVHEFHHTAWTSEQGAPEDMYAMAQTPDGWLWLGGPRGLFRFDGVQFESVTPEGRKPEASFGVSFLFAEQSGDLWVGWLYGGVTRLGADGMARHYGADDGMPDAAVGALARDAQGVMWAATTRDLLRFDGERWQTVGAESGFTDASAISLLLDERGTLWISGVDSIYRVHKGERRVERTGLKSQGIVDFLESPDGRAWYSDDIGVHVLPDQILNAKRSADANTRASRISLFDGEGHVWASDEAVVRRPVPRDAQQSPLKSNSASRFAAKDGLTSDRSHGLLEDREGNIWVITGGGVDRFRHTNVHTVTVANNDPEALVPASLGATDDGAAWIGLHDGTYGAGRSFDGLWKFDGHMTHVSPHLISEVTATARDANGSLWIAGAQGVWRQQLDGSFRLLPALPAEARGNQVHAIAIDGAGDPWVSVLQGTLYRLRAGVWQVNGGLRELPDARPNVHARDSTGRIWFGYRDGRIAIVENDEVSWYGTREGLQLGMITAIHSDHYTVVAGERTLAIRQDGRFHLLQATEQPSALEGVAGIAETSNGDLWMSGSRGAVRIAANDLQEALRSQRYLITPEVFDAQDGFPGMSLRVRPLPTLVRGTDDRLWFSGTLGVGWLDPQRVRRNSMPPPLHIRSVISDGAAHRSASAVRLPEGVQNLQINYTATSLSRPERVQFRYRLDGYDEQWIEAGPRRSAFYTNLAPGEYRFQVIAANDSGVWNETGASLAITIPPTFTQTRTFAALCVTAGLALLWAVYAIRIRQVTARERGRLEERLSERERIARELHDTLLQGVQGLILKFQVVVDRSDMPQQSRRDMNDALDRADALLLEGRERVKDLRRADTAPSSIRHQLLEAAELVGEQRATLRVIETGTPRDLHPIVREEAVRIASEAMFNAVRHAQAKTIEVEVAYERQRLRINVRDDGRGMEEQVIRAGRAGHFGFTGMQERTKRIRGQIGIWSRPGAGTEVSLTVPASMAYLRSRWSWRKLIMSVAPRHGE